MFHGKNFCSASWDTLVDRLRDAGFRVIAVDQIGFCKSTKPDHYVFTFQQLAANTHALLASLGISTVTIVAHSTGGMLGMRYALMYPDDVEQLAMHEPDWPRGLEGQGGSMGKPRSMGGARAQDQRRGAPFL